MSTKTVEQIRKDNFTALVREAGGVTRFAKKMEKSQSFFSQIIHGSPDTKTGKPKGIGNKLARDIERKFGKQIGWLDHEPEDREYLAFKALPAEIRAWIINQALPNNDYSRRHPMSAPIQIPINYQTRTERRERQHTIPFPDRRRSQVSHH